MYYVGDCNCPGIFAVFTDAVKAHNYSDFIESEGAASYVLDHKPSPAEGETFEFVNMDNWTAPDYWPFK